MKGTLADLQIQAAPEPHVKMWDDLGILLTVSQAGSFAQAEPLLGINQATIGRRIAGLEQALGVEILRRSAKGVVLTDVGKSIAHEAEQMRRHANVIRSIARGHHKGSPGKVNLAVSDGLAKYFLAPQVGEMRRRSPSTYITFNCTHVPVDLEQNHADIVIGFQPYSSFDIVNLSLGWIHMQPFASPAYLETAGCPGSADELSDHTLVDHLAYGIDQGDWGFWKAIEPAGVPFSANLSTVHYELVKAGAGIGLLPNYARQSSDLVALDLNFSIRMQVYLSYPRRLRTNRDIRAVVDWIKWVFLELNAAWLREDFSVP